MWNEYFVLVALFLLLITTCAPEDINRKGFPNGFLFGTASSSYQIEGAWNVNGKGENIWDRYTHKTPGNILDGSNGDIACDSYHKFYDDVKLMKDVGVHFYRFSLSWSRILPDGFSNKINPDGIRYYNDLINLLLEEDIIPMVTLFHWDLPQPLQELGGFANELIVEWFEDYAKVAFENFGDRVKLWITFNEPNVICEEGYGRGTKAPGYKLTGIAEYLCGHNLLKAHARAYHLYDKHIRPLQNGKISIALPLSWFEPATTSESDIEAAQRTMDFLGGWFSDPIYHPNGNYPLSMRIRIAARSKAEGFPNSRLPKFTKTEVKYIKGTSDYFALNHYTSRMSIHKNNEAPISSKPSYIKDINVLYYAKPEWPKSASSWLRVVPWGFRKLLNYINNRYGNITIYVTENGFSDHGELDDQGRISYYEQYLSAMLDAIHEDGVNVKGYTAWSILDNFEWGDGYVNRFGIHHVDFNDPDRPRKQKSSAVYYKQVIANNRLPFRNN